MWECNGKLPRLDIDASDQGQCGHMLRAQDDGSLQEARGRRDVALLKGVQSIVVQVVRLPAVVFLAFFGLSELQLFAPPLLLLGVRRQCSLPLPLVFNTIGVPRKPKCLRIWFIRYRSSEKCSGAVRLVNSTNVGGRTDACVM